MARLLVQFPGEAEVAIDGKIRGRTNVVIPLATGEYRIELADVPTEPTEHVVTVAAGADADEIVWVGFVLEEPTIDRFSPLYCRYNGFLLGQFLSLSFASFAREHYPERRARMLEFLKEIEADVPLAEEPPELGSPEQVALLQTVIKKTVGRSVELTQFILLGAMLTHYGLLAESDPETARESLEQIEKIREQYELPPIDPARFVVSKETRDPEKVLSPSLAYLCEIVDKLETEEDTAFVIMPFKPPFASYFATFYRPSLESVGYRALRAWGDLSNEDYGDLLIKLIEKVGQVWADISEFNVNVMYEIGAAHALRKVSMLVVREDLAGTIPANIGRDAVIRYSPEDQDWPGGAVRLMAVFLSLLKVAAERGERLRFGSGNLKDVLQTVGARLARTIVPEEARVAFRTGVQKQEEGDYAGAERCYDEAIALGLDGAPSMLGRGTVRAKLGRLAEAESDLSQTIEREVGDDETEASRQQRRAAAYLRGVVREQLENFEGAHDDYGTAIELGYPGTEPFQRRAFVRIQLGRLDEARLDVERLRDLAPDEPETHEAEADLLLAQDRYEEAVGEYDASLAVQSNANVEFARALALLLADRPADALSGYRQGAAAATPEETRWALEDLDRRAADKPGGAECRAVLEPRPRPQEP